MGSKDNIWDIHLNTKIVVNFGRISHFVYETDYRDISGLDILKARGITVIKLETANEKESNLES